MNEALGMPEHPRIPQSEIVAEEFFCDRDYRNRRSLGSGDYLLISTIAGSGWFVTTSGESLQTHPGEVVLYHPDDYQEYHTHPEVGYWRLQWSHFPIIPRVAALLEWPVSPLGLRHLRLSGESDEAVRTAFSRLIALGETPHAALRLNALEEVLLWIGVTLSSGLTLPIDPRIRKGTDFLTTQLVHPFSLPQLARYCGMSVSRFSGLFRQQVGMTPLAFLEHQRMAYARRLLVETALPIGEIAQQVGYEDPFYFSTRFRHYAQVSPSGYRKRLPNTT